MDFTIEDIKKIRNLTGVGLTDAKKALTQSSNFEEALRAMQAKGLSKVSARDGKQASCGVIMSYVHDYRIGVLIEINCETDFVAKNQQFLDFAKDIALQIAASAPTYISLTDVPANERQAELEALRQRAAEEGIEEDKREQVILGQLEKSLAQQCLLAQSFNKDPNLSIHELLASQIARLGEKIVIARFVRFALGEEQAE